MSEQPEATDNEAIWPHQAIILVAPRCAGQLEFVSPGIAALPGFEEFMRDVDAAGRCVILPPTAIKDKDFLLSRISLIFDLYIENCRQQGVPLPEHAPTEENA